MQTIQRRTDIRSRLCGCPDTTTRQDATGYRTDLQFVAQSLSGLLFLSRQFFYMPINIRNFEF